MASPETYVSNEPAGSQIRFDADKALHIVDEIITDIYLPFRGAPGYGTERAIFVENPHVPHRENDAEHSWHIAFTAQVLWDFREQLNLEFADDFDIDLANKYAHIHDLPEIWSRDVDALTLDQTLVDNKQHSEQKVIKEAIFKYPYLRAIAAAWDQYEKKDSSEAQFINDIDKVVATRIICLDGGKKWHGFEGYSASREWMCEKMRSKLKTPFGNKLFDVLERDLDNHPEWFPESGKQIDQGRLF